MTVLTQPRKTRVIPQREESQESFVARANRELYRKIPDATKRNRYILKCWREAGRDGQLVKMAAERFPENKFQTIHDLPIFPEHATVGSDGKRRIYDRKALQTIVEACNNRILDTGDFSALTAGHTPDDPTSAASIVPEVLGYEGPFRLGMIGNIKPKWCIFADEHHRRDRLAELEHRPRRSAEVWLEDNILDPIAALGAETPRLDTGIVRNCRLPSGRVVEKYSAMATSPVGMNTSPQTFGKPSREKYAAGESQMPLPTDNTLGTDENIDGLSDQDIERIALRMADIMLQTKHMKWVESQMPPDWTPGDGEIDEVPEEHADLPDEGLGDEGLPDEGAEDTTFQPEGDGGGADLDLGDETAPIDDGMGGEPPADVGAETAAEFPEDEAMPDEIEGMDDEDKERYAAHDSAGRKGFLQAWRKHNRRKEIYSAGGAPMPQQRESYSRLAAKSDEQEKTIKAQQARIEQLEGKNRRRERYSRLAELHQTHAFELDAELDEVADLPDDQFERHCTRIKEKYAKLPVARGGYTAKLPVEQAEVIATPTDEQKKVDKYSRRAMEIANAALKANPKQGMPWEEAFEQAVKEIDGGTVAAK